jgi:hypothetical protein
MNDDVESEPLRGELRAPTASPNPGALMAPIPGSITQQIGSGEHARNSIVYRTILWSFIGGGLLSAASMALALCLGKPAPIGDLKDIWSIFVPMITLALGYVFGKGR